MVNTVQPTSVNPRGGLLCFVGDKHQPASAEQPTCCLTPIGGRGLLFTELTKRVLLRNPCLSLHSHGYIPYAKGNTTSKGEECIDRGAYPRTRRAILPELRGATPR